MGLVYYSVTWTVLAYLFFDNMVVIAIGILTMSYGDGFASIIGMRFGNKKYDVFGDKKSYAGSLAMFVFTFVTTMVALLYYQVPVTIMAILVLLFISLVAAVTEGITPKGLDNLTAPFAAVFVYWLVFLSGFLCV
jgi:dolichol kinase